MTHDELHAARAAAGAAYATAAAAMRAALVELHAHDLALSNGNVKPLNSAPVDGRFLGLDTLHVPAHTEFAPDMSGFAGQHIHADTEIRCRELVAAVTGRPA